MAARRAGTALATSATPRSVATTAAIVKGSVLLTWKSWLANTRLAAIAARMPRTAPTATGRMACDRISRTTLPRVAPSAIRTPISCVRWLTK